MYTQGKRNYMPTKEEITEFLQREFPQFTYEIESVGERTAVIRHHTSEIDLRPGGTVSGPTLFGLADAGLYVAILAELGIIALAVTTNVSINFLRKPSADKDVIARCKLIKVGKTLVVGEVNLYSDGDAEPIAHAVGTYSIPPK